MTKWFRKELPENLDYQIECVLNSMEYMTPEEEEYEKLLEYLERLMKLQRGDRRKWSVSPDTLAIVLGNLAGILIVVMYEQKHVMTTKAFGLQVKHPNN